MSQVKFRWMQATQCTLFFMLYAACLFPAKVAHSQSQPVASASTRQSGTVESVAPEAITLKTDAGQEIVVQLAAETKVVKLPAGSRDMKYAQPIALKDIEVGDRVLVRGKQGDAPGSFQGNSLLVMKGSEIEQKRQQDREDWQKRGVGGMVAGVDTTANTVTVSTGQMGALHKTVIHVSGATVIRRYAPDSVKFEDAQAATLAQIKAGDQLRARGPRSPEGDVEAEEIVSGSFRNVAGIVVRFDEAAALLQVKDYASQKVLSLKISADSQLRHLPPMVAQMMARRAAPLADAAATGKSPAAADAESSGMHSPGGSRAAPDLQTVLGKLPKMPVADIHASDAVMVVATPGSGDTPGTVISLLTGVEAIFAATPKGSQVMTLSPWNINGSPGDSSSTP